MALNPRKWFHRFDGVTHVHANMYRSALPQWKSDLEMIAQRDIEVVFSFEEDTDGDALRARGFDWRPHFWTDDEPPTRDEVLRFLDDVATVPQDVRALFHCRAGWGRTGVAICAVLIAHHGWNADQALQHFWGRVPAARRHQERNGQAAFVRAFAADVQGRGLAPVDAPRLPRAKRNR